MNRNRNLWLIFILLLTVFSVWIDFSNQIRIDNPFTQEILFNRNVAVKLGLDLRGGLQALLEADVPADRVVSPEEMSNTKTILENRANGLGVSEVVMQVAGDRRVVAEFPGVNNPDEVVATLQQTALLEFVDMGDASGLGLEGTVIVTDTDPSQAANGETIYHTVMTGAALDTVGVGASTLTSNYVITFTLKANAAQTFAEYTTANVGKTLAIVLDKKIISAPTIKEPITGGEGSISGNFTQDSANTLAIQLRSGSLPVPMKVVESRTVGPTLGEESVRKSVLAGAIGLTVVILFMAFNYRLPGVIADLALIIYALISLMLFKLIPVTLTLPGIAGFILSIGMAVDANVLIFERLKEELRAGRSLSQAIDLAWSRAWPSIRDSNISTLITSLILWTFGNTFGASMVKGFSITLALGVLVSLFTAITVTRTFLHAALDNFKLGEHHAWFGL